MLGKHKKGKQGRSGSPAVTSCVTANTIKGVYKRLRSRQDPDLLHKEVVTLHSTNSAPESWFCLAKINLHQMVEVLQGRGSAMSACRQGVKMHKSMLCAMLYMRLLQAFASADPWFEASLVEQLISYPDEVLEQEPHLCKVEREYQQSQERIDAFRAEMVAACRTEPDTHSNTFLMCDAVKLAGQLESAGLLSSMQEQQLRANGILQIRCEGPTEKSVYGSTQQSSSEKNFDQASKMRHKHRTSPKVPLTPEVKTRNVPMPVKYDKAIVQKVLRHVQQLVQGTKDKKKRLELLLSLTKIPLEELADLHEHSNSQDAVNEAGQLMALKPPAGSITSSMWVLPDGPSAEVHLWPHPNSPTA